MKDEEVQQRDQDNFVYGVGMCQITQMLLKILIFSNYIFFYVRYTFFRKTNGPW